MNTKISIKHVLPLCIALSATCNAEIVIPLSSALSPVTFGNQLNTGSQVSGIVLTNIVVTGAATVNSTAIGNAMNGIGEQAIVNLDNSNVLQTSLGSTNASVFINGNSEFGKLTANATSIGNAQNITASASSTMVNMAAQSNSGYNGASVTWVQDPTGAAWLNSTALGNTQTITFK